jgi:hypothetical protein
VSGNSLISLRWFDKIINDMMRVEIEKHEAALQEYLDKGYAINELASRVSWDGKYSVHVITQEEFWLDWHSDNHGWST